MRHLVIILFITLFSSSNLIASDNRQDSLIQTLKAVAEPIEQIRIYRNIADLEDKESERLVWLMRMYDLSRQTKYTDQTLEILTDIVESNLAVDSIDLAKYYIMQIEKLAPQNQKDRWLSYAKMCLFNVEVYADDNADVINERISQFGVNGEAIYENEYANIEHAYIMAMALFVQRNFEEAMTHSKLSVDLARRLSVKDGVNYKIETMSLLGRIYTRLGQYQQSVDVLEECITAQELYVKTYLKSKRPYYNLNSFYVRNYTSLLINVNAMPREKSDYYLGRILELSKISTDSSERYNCFLCLNNYYMAKKSWTSALVMLDSLIQYAKDLCPYNLPGNYAVTSLVYDKMGKYEDALRSLRKSIRLKDSIEGAINQDKISKLHVEYGLDKLNYEKSKLEIRNKRLLTTVLVVVLSFVLIVCVYLYINLRREKRIKEDMRILKIQAEESEKMKSEFVNSICHEVRTPLNAIAGFSNVIADTSIDLDPDSKQALADEISTNTDKLTSLINSMIEVASLNVSEANLPCEPTDIATICVSELKTFLSANTNPEVEYILHIPDTQIIVNTNPHYLSVVIENLLSNSKKFTEKGRIILSCEVSYDKVIIKISDTGCGIAAEYRNAVFERFMKINTFTEGSGLGLYLCRLIISRLSGVIYVSDSYEQGTQIVVELPLSL